MTWESLAAVVAVVAPLVGGPLAAILFYLRSIRDYQTTEHAETAQRIDHLEQGIRDILRRLGAFERDYTTKEEWLREAMHARRQLERLTELSARMCSQLEHTRQLAATFVNATRAMTELMRDVAVQVRAHRPHEPDLQTHAARRCES